MFVHVGASCASIQACVGWHVSSSPHGMGAAPPAPVPPPPVAPVPPVAPAPPEPPAPEPPEPPGPSSPQATSVAPNTSRVTHVARVIGRTYRGLCGSGKGVSQVRRTTSTEPTAFSTTRSATLPINARSNPVRPCVAITMRDASSSAATCSTTSAARPSRTSHVAPGAWSATLASSSEREASVRGPMPIGKGGLAVSAAAVAAPSREPPGEI